MVDNCDFYTARYTSLKAGALVNLARGLNLQKAIQTRTSWYVLYVNDFAARLPGSAVLELGFGDGLNPLLMAQAGAKVTAVEIALPAVETLSEASHALGLDVTAVHGDFLEMDLPKFDYIVGKGLLHHLDMELEARFLEKCARLLNPSGEARFAEPAVNSELLDKIRWMVPVPDRPSMLNRKRFQSWKDSDPHPDRDNSSRHYFEIGRRYFEHVNVTVFGGLERFRRLIVNRDWSNAYAAWALRTESRYLPQCLHRPIARGQAVLYSKPLISRL
jgi:SAM-dependent methyltransferase